MSTIKDQYTTEEITEVLGNYTKESSEIANHHENMDLVKMINSLEVKFLKDSLALNSDNYLVLSGELIKTQINRFNKNQIVFTLKDYTLTKSAAKAIGQYLIERATSSIRLGDWEDFTVPYGKGHIVVSTNGIYYSFSTIDQRKKLWATKYDSEYKNESNHRSLRSITKVEDQEFASSVVDDIVVNNIITLREQLSLCLSDPDAKAELLLLKEDLEAIL
jgi:hypothetical protein